MQTYDFDFDHKTGSHIAGTILHRAGVTGKRRHHNNGVAPAESIEWGKVAMILRAIGADAFAQTMANHLPSDPEAPMRQAMYDTIVEAASEAGQLEAADSDVRSPFFQGIGAAYDVSYRCLARARLELGQIAFGEVLKAVEASTMARH